MDIEKSMLLGFPLVVLFMANMSEINQVRITSAYGVAYSPQYWGCEFIMGYYLAIFLAWGLFHYTGVFSEKGD